MTLQKTLFAALNDPAHGWSMGSFGAIAEFHRTPDDPLLRDEPGLKATAKGAIRLAPESARAIAYEGISPKPGRWSQSVALCLPARMGMARRSVLTRLGADQDAILPDYGGVLYDLGLGQPQVDFCIRTDDPALIRVLDRAEGRPVFAPDNPAMSAILAAHPHRVALTGLGRVEVFQMIGGPDTGGVSPPGPHTHVLPKLMASGRTHSANMPVPPGWVPCAGFHPSSPISDAMGHPRAYDPVAAAAFRHWLTLWGPVDYVAMKDEVRAALTAGLAPARISARRSRLERAAVRVALRQWLAEGRELPADWARLDRGAPGSGDEPHEQGH